MEFLRFGSKIPGSYWGCCAVCIIQNFKFDPDDKASMQRVSGDQGYALTIPRGMPNVGKPAYVGPTYRDIFKTMIRTGTHTLGDMPNHTFLAVLTESQIAGKVGKKWLAILKEEGFEFIRAVDNSVYTGPAIEGGTTTSHPNYLFGLFRNISAARIEDPFTPPKAWTDLEGGTTGATDVLGLVNEGGVTAAAFALEVSDGEDVLARLAKVQTDYHTARWKEGKTVFVTEEELIEAGAPVMKAGVCTTPPANITEEVKKRLSGEPEAKSPFPPAPTAA